MATTAEPRTDLAKKVLPQALYQSLLHIFAQGIQGCALVGGTALAGFYSGHRRSDDLDLFVNGDIFFQATVLAVKSLTSMGAVFHNPYETAQYFHLTCEVKRKTFTIAVVNDPNLFRTGKIIRLESGVCVATLETLLKMKAATLVSRCSEKDLYDLLWLFGQFNDLKFEDLVRLGHEVDNGVTGEGILLGVSGATLRESACNFSLDPKKSPAKIYKDILTFQKQLLLAVSQFLRNQPVPPLGELVRTVSKLKGKS